MMCCMPQPLTGRSRDTMRRGVRGWMAKRTLQLAARTQVRGAGAMLDCRSAFDIYAAAAAQFSPERVAALTGVAPSDLANAAAILGGASSVAYYCWNGVGQSVTATQTDRAISLLYTLTGSYGGQGGNVPGGAAPFADISGQDLLSPEQRAKALGLAERPLGPGLQGYITARDAYRAVVSGDPYPVRMLVSFGTNLLASQPDTELAQARARAARVPRPRRLLPQRHRALCRHRAARGHLVGARGPAHGLRRQPRGAAARAAAPGGDRASRRGARRYRHRARPG